MPHTPAKSLGKTLSWGAAPIPGLQELEIHYGSRKVIPVGDLSTTLAATEPVLFGLRDPDKITGTVLFDKDDTVHAAMKAAFLAATPAAVVYTRTDPTTPSTETWSSAVITDFKEPSGNKDSAALATFEITCAAVGVPA